MILLGRRNFAAQRDVHGGMELDQFRNCASLNEIACVQLTMVLGVGPELDFGFVGPGDLAMSMGLHTRDTILGMMKAKEMQARAQGLGKKVVHPGKFQNCMETISSALRI